MEPTSINTFTVRHKIPLLHHNQINELVRQVSQLNQAPPEANCQPTELITDLVTDVLQTAVKDLFMYVFL